MSQRFDKRIVGDPGLNVRLAYRQEYAPPNRRRNGFAKAPPADGGIIAKDRRELAKGVGKSRLVVEFGDWDLGIKERSVCTIRQFA